MKKTKANSTIVLKRHTETKNDEEEVLTIDTLKKLNEFFSDGITYCLAPYKYGLKSKKDNLNSIIDDLDTIKKTLKQMQDKEDEKERKRFRWDFLTMTPFAFNLKMNRSLRQIDDEENED